MLADPKTTQFELVGWGAHFPIANSEERFEVEFSIEDIESCYVVKAYRSTRYFVLLNDGRELSPLMSTVDKDMVKWLKKNANVVKG